MTKKIIPYIFLLLPFFVIAQRERKEETPNVNSQLTIDVGLSGAQLGYEFTTGRNSTLQLRGGIAPVLYDFRYDGWDAREIVAAVILSGEFRAYYNLQKRKEQGKNISNNGGNYLGALVTYLGQPLNPDTEAELYRSSHIFMFGPVWGMNRSLGKKIYFHFSIGPAILTRPQDKRTTLSLNGDLRFCFKLTK